MKRYKGIQPSTPATLGLLMSAKLRKGAVLSKDQGEYKPWFLCRVDEIIKVDLATYEAIYKALRV